MKKEYCYTPHGQVISPERDHALGLMLRVHDMKSGDLLQEAFPPRITRNEDEMRSCELHIEDGDISISFTRRNINSGYVYSTAAVVYHANVLKL